MSELPCFLRLNNIPLYVHNAFASLFTCWRTLGLFPCFGYYEWCCHELKFSLLSLFGLNPEMYLLDHPVILCFIFSVTAMHLPIVAVSFHFPIKNIPIFLHPRQHLLFSEVFGYLIFYSSLPNGYEVVYHCDFHFYFPND